MNLTKLFSRVAFNNAIVKLILNQSMIESVIGEFKNKTFDGWEQRDCPHCKPPKLCKKHSAISRVEKATQCIKIEGMDIDESLDGVYIRKSDIFILNSDRSSALIVDCPPLRARLNTQINDTWVRKVTPFSFGNFKLKPGQLKVNQVVNINDVVSNRMLQCRFGTPENSSLIVLYNMYGSYHWEITTSDNKTIKENK